LSSVVACWSSARNAVLSPTTFDYVVPDLPGASFYLGAEARQPVITDQNRSTLLQRNGISAPASGFVLELPPAPQLAGPVNVATDVSISTPFHWVAGQGQGINILVFQPIDENHPEYAVYMSGEASRIPDLRSVGLGLPGLAWYAWGVARLFPIRSMDDLCGAERWTAVPPEVGVGFSEGRYFLTGTFAGASELAGGAQGRPPRRSTEGMFMKFTQLGPGPVVSTKLTATEENATRVQAH
jgi:hypothetical protein